MRTLRFVSFCVAVCIVCSLSSALGDSQPPGPPGSEAARMKSLNQIEPRAVIGGLPFVITNAGAYYLTGSLTGVSGSNGVFIACSDVRLDLNRFALVGVPGSHHGVKIADGASNITIQDGVIRNWGGAGLLATNATDSRLMSVTVQTNGFGFSTTGAWLGDTWLVDDCVFLESASNGLNVADHCTVRETKALRNGYGGIRADNDCRIVGCTAGKNAGSGIIALDHCTIRDCLASKNGYNGIAVAQHCRVIDNHCANNAVGGYGAGVQVTGYGNRVEGNTLAKNRRGVYSYEWCQQNLIIRNNAIGNTLINYELSTNDRLGQVLGFYDIQQEFTNSNPWANFSF